MNISAINSADDDELKTLFLQCCSSSRWAKAMISGRPYRSRDHLLKSAGEVWDTMERDDFLEAFDGHPRIGDTDSLKAKYRNTRKLAADEQSSIDAAADEVLSELAKYNNSYQDKFGYIFIVCAAGKSAARMLEILKQRIENESDAEIKIAAAEQAKITAIRLNRLII